MSRVLLICTRSGSVPRSFASDIIRLNRSLTPDNIDPVTARMTEANGLTIATFNPSACLDQRDTAVCLGFMQGSSPDWAEPGAPVPDGSYALFRANDDAVELVSDITASRTIWYAHTSDLFVASSSQRAIVSILGGFEPNRLAFSWFLSSGTLGPELSWDQRIHALPANSTLTLNRSRWTVTRHEERVCLNPVPGSHRHYERKMLDVLHSTFDLIAVDRFKWAVPLSGGYDSRAILLFLKDRTKVEAVTWGTEESLLDAGSDAAIAVRVARAFGVRHRFVPIGESNLPAETVISRYLVAGEGRVDHLGGYLDGFGVWQQLYDGGFDASLRGDVCWPHIGDTPARPFCVRQNWSIRLLRLSDYHNLPNSTEWELPEQPLPAKYEPLAGECLADYRDRIYQEFRMPTTLSALNDLKAAYIEIANPFLTANFIRLVRSLPLSVRWDKRLLKGIVEKHGPKLPFASRSATVRDGDITMFPAFRTLILEELGSTHAHGVLSEVLLCAAKARFEELSKSSPRKPTPARRRAGSVRRVVRSLRRGIAGPRPLGSPTMHPETLALRATLISRMCRLLSEDGQTLRGQQQPNPRSPVAVPSHG